MRIFVWCLALLLAGSWWFSGSSFVRADDANQTPTPNIVLILADDLGYGDLQCYNRNRGKIPTPHLDHLATQGMRFTDAHSSSGVCSPSRYTLLTGRYHWRTRLQRGIVSYLERPLISPERLTLPGLLQDQGYHTACIGKWHLGWNWNVPRDQRHWFDPPRDAVPTATDKHRAIWQRYYSQPISGGPIERGFDRYFGTDVPNWPPYCFIQQDQTVGIPSTFLPERWFQKNLASLRGPAVEDWKLEAILPTLADQACDYIEQQAKDKTPFFLYLPLTSPHTPLAVNQRWQGKSGLDNAAADLIMETDAVVGQVLETIDRSEISDRTIVIFTSDNGFAPYVGVRQLESQGHYSSGPWRGYKGDVWEGGHRVPLIVRWPDVTPAQSVCDHLVHQADLMATIADLLGVSLPRDAGEDSFSLLPLWKGQDHAIRSHSVSQGAQGLLALREGQWKLILGPGGGGPWSHFSARPDDGKSLQLYDLMRDRGETTNLASANPERVESMLKTMQQLVEQGRSNPGPPGSNDVAVQWQRFLPKE